MMAKNVRYKFIRDELTFVAASRIVQGKIVEFKEKRKMMGETLGVRTNLIFHYLSTLFITYLLFYFFFSFCVNMFGFIHYNELNEMLLTGILRLEV